MKIYQFRCKLLSDVIITSEAATEGSQSSLDYLPGSKFMGVLAGQLYDEANKERTLDLFHNGAVQFGDAFPTIDDKTYLKVPFSWFTEKGEKITDTIYLHHQVDDNDKQLKQVRKGYFSPDNHQLILVDSSYALKSAQSRKNRRSEDGQMFGYESLKAGTEWIFEVRDEKGVYGEEIMKGLEGKHRIGRSRSAEYGLVEISFSKETADETSQSYTNQIIVYAKSNLCFVNDKKGAYVTQPLPEQVCGDAEAKILWEKSQIRTRNYKVWNRKRWNKDADRVIIEKGSVFVLNLKNPVSSEFFRTGIGCHKNEGFGQVLINPDFLSSKSEILPFKLAKRKFEGEKQYIAERNEKDDFVLKALRGIYQRNDFDAKIDRMVNAFKEEYGGRFSGISKSQWGTLRNYGKNLDKPKHFKDLVFDENSGFLYRGQSEHEWQKQSRRTILEKYVNDLNDRDFFPFIVKLSNQMAKKK